MKRFLGSKYSRRAEGRCGCRPAPRIAGVAQDLMDAALARQTPAEFLAARAAHHLGQQDVLVAEIQHALAGAAQFGELAEHRTYTYAARSRSTFLFAAVVSIFYSVSLSDYRGSGFITGVCLLVGYLYVAIAFSGLFLLEKLGILDEAAHP
jgi:hypothetical protein